MPLVKSTIEVTVPVTMSKTTTEHTTYVPPGKVKPDDIIVEPTDRQLAELALEHPDEYATQAKDRKITPGATVGLDTRLRDYMAKSAKDLTKAIHDLNPDDGADLQLLVEILEAETGDEGGKRATVISALKNQGIEE